MLISFAVTAKLICIFVFAYAKTRFSHKEAHLSFPLKQKYMYIVNTVLFNVRKYNSIFSGEQMAPTPQVSLCWQFYDDNMALEIRLSPYLIGFSSYPNDTNKHACLKCFDG